MKLAELVALFHYIVGIHWQTNSHTSKNEVIIPTKKLKFVSVVLEEILRVAGSCIFT
jgi:hypothetical protein